jgi:V/A-type H+-transporting ATPase subunit A
MSKKAGTIIKVSGPLVIAIGLPNVKMYDLVRVSEKELLGEVIELRGEEVSIQVYEETGGIGPGEPVYSTGEPLSVELGPGLVTSIYDGIQRPLNKIMEKAGNFITRGIKSDSLDREKVWEFKAKCKTGDKVEPGDILGVIQETEVIEHRIMVPPGVKGTIEEIKSGKYKVEDIIVKIKTKEGIKELNMIQKWPVRKERLYKEKLPPSQPLVTGQRVVDTFFPITQGGVACVPGPFGAGKTVILHQFAKWADAQIVVYIGCGERGNEMTDVLMEFPELDDPRTGKKLINRTILIANTSNMPVAAREASIYTGITIAEYFRDMGYSVAVMADSTSRWAEALREMSGRLEEMPGEEGYPAYLPIRAAQFYERAGRVVCAGSEKREGFLSVLGAVSPPGGDLSDPVVQATLKVVQVFWSLQDTLAYKRHFPAIDWLSSYSLYHDNILDYMSRQIAEDWGPLRVEAMKLLQEEAELEEIARLVGVDSLSPKDRLILETTRSIREDFLHQNAFHEIDTYTSLNKQYRMLKCILLLHEKSLYALDNSVDIEKILKLKVKEDIANAKFIEEKELNKYDEIEGKIEKELSELIAQREKI